MPRKRVTGVQGEERGPASQDRAVPPRCATVVCWNETMRQLFGRGRNRFCEPLGAKELRWSAGLAPVPHLGPPCCSLRAARRLPSPRGLRGLTYFTRSGLLVVTGLRISEAVALEVADVSVGDAILTIRRTKRLSSSTVTVP